MSNSDKKRAKLIIERWSSELATKSSSERSRHKVSENFDSLFYDLWKSSIPFDVVHDMLSDIISKHFPNQTVAKRTFTALKPHMQGKTFVEFLEDWKESIKHKAMQSFYALYPIDGENKTEEKKFGSMSAQEYSKQRKYADSFPRLDIEALKKQREEMLEDIQIDLDELEVDDE